MLEAVGEKLWHAFFAQCDRLLAHGGRACIQTIVVPDERFARYRSSPDWIERPIFPGCLIPSRAALHEALRPTRLRIGGDEEIGGSYTPTLRAWRERFHAGLTEVRALGYDERFRRIWSLWLALSEAGFREARRGCRPGAPVRAAAGRHQPTSDEALVSACATGDSAALGELFDRHNLAVYRFLSRLLGANRAYVDQRIPHLSRLMASSAREVVDHAEVVVVGTADPDGIAELGGADGRIIVDLVRFPGSEEYEGDGRYVGVCW